MSNYEITATQHVADMSIVVVTRFDRIAGATVPRRFTLVSHADGIDRIVTPNGGIFDGLAYGLPDAIAEMLAWYSENV